MTKIDQIWKDIENDSTFNGGLLLRRYSGHVLPNIYVGIKTPLKLRCLIVKVSKTTKIEFIESAKLKDITIEFRQDEKDVNSKLLILLLTNVDFNDLFSTVCEDLINCVANLSIESEIIRELLNRYEKWILLFDAAHKEGLSEEFQRGLYGEVYFIREWLKSSNNSNSRIINAWQGPDKYAKDFQIEDWAVEVKTTHGNNHQKIHISNERQLDTSSIKALFLYHISLNVVIDSGETLNEIITQVRLMLDLDFRVLNQFNTKLLIAGYFNHHHNLYEKKGYSIRQTDYYKVKDDFPRIEEVDLRKGVGDIKYSIIMSNCQKHIINADDLFKTIN